MQRSPGLERNCTSHTEISLPSSSGFAPMSPAREESVGGDVGREIDVRREDAEDGLEPRVVLHSSPVAASVWR